MTSRSRELGRQIDEAAGYGGEGAREGEETAADGAGDPEADPVERGLHELGQKIDKANGAGKRRRHRPEHGPKRRSKRRAAVWVLGVLGLVVTLLAGATAGYAWYLNHEIHRIPLHNLTSAPGTGADANTENILMIGSTSRCALKVQNPAYGLCSQGVDGVNSDVVMILHLDPANGSLSILSIPRDLFVPNARSDGANKIDAALYQGPDQLINAIEENLGIPIQHFVELNFDSFINIVQALGGIKMYFPEPVFDAYSGLNIQTTGCIDLNGTQALQVVRARHLQYKAPGVTSTDPNDWPQENQSDLARIRRDHEFLRVLATAVKQRGLSNPITDQSLVAGVVGQLTVDSGFSASDMINLVLGYHNVDVNTRAPADAAGRRRPVRQLRVPGRLVRRHRVPGRAAGPPGDRPVPRPLVEQRRHLLGRRAACALVGHRVGAERIGRVQPGDGHGGRTRNARVPHRDDRRLPTRRPGGGDRRLLLVEDPRRAGGSPGGGQLHVGRRDHGRGPDAGPTRITGHGRHRDGLLGQSTGGGPGGRDGDGGRDGGSRRRGEHDHDDLVVTSGRWCVRRAHRHRRASGAMGPAVVHLERRRRTLT